jgi:glycosyltransferase involved in cell wall biosynthesis
MIKKKKLLLMSDSVRVFTGFANVGRHVADYLYDTGKYDIAYLCWFDAPINNIIPKYTTYTTLRDHSRCCNRGPVVMKMEPGKAPSYLKHNQGILLPMGEGPACFNGPNMDHDKYAYESLHGTILDFQPDIVWGLGDTWMQFHTNLMDIRNCFQYYEYCFSPDTDIMTKEGIKNISNVKEGELVFSINPETKVCSYKKVIRTTERTYSGNMVSIQSMRIDQLTTPEHRVLLDDGKFVTAEEITKRSISHLPTPNLIQNHSGDNKINVNMLDYCDDDAFILIPVKYKTKLCNSYDCNKCGYIGITDQPVQVKCSQCRSRNVQVSTGLFNKSILEDHYYHHELVYKFRKQELSIEQLDFIISLNQEYQDIRLRGADDEHDSLPILINKESLLKLGGWFVSEGSIENVNCYICQLSQFKYIEQLTKDIENIDIRFSRVPNGYKIYGKIMYNFFTRNFGFDSYTKKIDKNIFDISSTNDLEILFDRMMLGDGSFNKVSYYTVCKQLADDVIRLCFIIGKQGVLYKSDRIYRIGIWSVSNSISIKPEHTELIPYNGIVKCLSVEDNGTVLAGRNNKLGYIGQCPIDGKPMPYNTNMGNMTINWVDTLNKADKAFAFCDFGRDTMIKTGALYGVDLKKVGVIYHGADIKTYHKLDNKMELRKKWFPEIKDNVFLVGFFSRNQPRKAVHKWCEAIAIGIKKGYWTEDTLQMYGHFPWRDVGWEIPDLIKTHGLEKYFIKRDKLQVGQGPSDIEMNELYNCCDLTTLPTRGEGWSLTISESMAAGTPTLISAYSAHHDWAEQAAARIKIATLDSEPLTNIDRAIVDVNDYADKIKAFYDNITIEEFVAKFGPVTDYKDERDEKNV